MPRVNLLLALLWLPFVVGCDGCRRQSDQEEQEQQTPLGDFSARVPQAFPAAGTLSDGIKPGHWITASQALKSNKIDIRGQLLSRSTASSAGSVDGRTEITRGDLPATRPVVLPKGQFRRFEYRILTPIPLAGDQRSVSLENRFLAGGRMIDIPNTEDQYRGARILSGEEFHFVVLTERPERFTKFQVSDWVKPYRSEDEYESSRANYRIVVPPTDDLIPLAETMLDWTSTAILFWDDLSPDALTPQQQRAVADWVRFGGQLIVNGAEASDSVSNTALAELLPLTPTANVELDPDAAAELLTSWGVASDRSTEKQIALLRSQSGRVAVDGPLSADAKAMDRSGNLLLTRQIGGGRVVQSRFDLTSDWLTNWQSYDSFVNAVLLSRPRRAFRESEEDLNAGMLQQRYPDFDTEFADPGFNSRFRITARDAILDRTQMSSPSSSWIISHYDPLTSVDSVTGISGWNDDSDVIALSRQILRSESGIEIPKSSLVVRSLGYYLLVLVPINYLFFRLIGRLEYAWLAVPVIAIGGAILVARTARLDIGFARSQTEMAFLEVHSGYSRAHLSRVVAIYNSLSSTYDLEFKTLDAAAAPVREGRVSVGDEGTQFRTGFAEGPVLSGLPVTSNQIRMVHVEQILDLGGTMEIDASGQLHNGSALELSDAVVVKKGQDGEMNIAVVGPLTSGSTVRLRFRPFDEVTLPDDLPMQASRMVRALASPLSLPNGEIRMVARYDGALEGMTVTPATQQASAQTIVLAHLQYPDWPQARVDMNLIGDFRRVLSDDDDKLSTEPNSDDPDNS